ncbi:thiamine pyrophosphate-binding protein [Thalassospiraceae bacterium LMO-JJ14]|nr:thiamine pyrophosphate-binding protein [Thalassospiraceae bacterium LMO-JJ14]
MASLAEEIAKVLKARKVTRIFGIPGGGSSLDLIDAADKAGIPFTLTRTEAAATIMAAVTGELTGAPGAVLVGVGPGASSATNGLAYASLERSPMVLFIDGPASTMHQHFNQQAMFAPISRGTARLQPADGAEVLDNLLKTTLSAPEGPVMVELTAGDAAAKANTCIPSDDATPPPPSTDDLAAAASMIAASKRPMVIVGLEARLHADAVRAFADRLGCAAMTTYKAGGIISAESPGFIGPITGAAGEMPILQKADLIIGIGFDPIEFIPGTWPADFPPFLQIGEGSPANPRVPFDLKLTGPLETILRALGDGLTDSGWADSGLNELKAIAERIYTPDSNGFSTAAAIDAIGESIDHGTRICVDAGAHMFATIGRWPATKPQGILKSNGLSTMGYALPAAIASALADPATPVMAVTGDGGISMCVGELATARELNLDITLVVMNDSALSLIDIKQQRQQRPSLGVRYPAQDFAAIAKAYGWQGVRANDATQLKAALVIPGPKLIDVRIDAAGYGDDMSRLRG